MPTMSRTGRNPRYSMATWPRSRSLRSYDISVRRLLDRARVALHGERETERAREEDGNGERDVGRDIAGCSGIAGDGGAALPRVRQLLLPLLRAHSLPVTLRRGPRPHR